MTNDVITLVERYLAERQRLGFDLRHSGYCLRSLARHVQRSNHLGPLTLEVMTQWAAQGRSSMPGSLHMARRMRRLRPFARWLLQFEPDTEVPDEAVCGHRPVRGTPHIYSDQEIEELLAAARRLGPPSSIRGLLYETLFGLLASTGLRISEALALRLADVDLQQGVLTIRRTKFGKSRAVPLHPSTTQALRAYRAGRDLTGAASGEDEYLFIGLRADILGTPLAGHQARLVFAGLRRELGWVNRGTHHAARIHDLRHTFVVRRVLLWQQQGVDVDQTMLSLSTYLGHAGVADTYWYLQAVPDLMAVAAQRFEACMPEVCDA
ncbi:tyrosine-type recombinase/integrase [Roseateles sp. LYH14W]|uniref:Tyrosine-type recombinase/integrase n=1 Tax=Pelomonas parva TaxID=3299032 RepID=A0ABW7F1L7_9BURK